MSSVVVLTDSIRKIPYFSSFSEDEKEVTIPRSYINESINPENIKELTTEQLVTFIENRVYLGFEKFTQGEVTSTHSNCDTEASESKESEELVKELIWRLGETEEKMNGIKDLPLVVEREVNSRISTKNSKYVYGIRCRVPLDNSTCLHITMHGNTRLLQWARDKGCQWSKRVCTEAIKRGHFELLGWACRNGCPRDTDLCINAVIDGKLELLKYLREIDCPWSEKICYYAVVYGRFEILKWARENGCPWGENVCNFAAEKGYLDILKWARENGCPWSERTCKYAAAKGRLDILKWLRENGCPWDKTSYEEARSNGHTHVLNWARENDCPRPHWYYGYDGSLWEEDICY